MIAAPHIPLFLRPFHFLRHGQTEHNAAGRIAGSFETELTELGHAQARLAAAALVESRISAIYSSPMKRARDTAEYVGRALGMRITIIDDIAERCWGDLEGQHRSARIPGVTPAGADTLDVFAQRILQGLGRIDATAPLIVAHSGVFRVLCRTLEIAEQDRPISNALPVHFEPLDHGWRMTAATLAT